MNVERFIKMLSAIDSKKEILFINAFTTMLHEFLFPVFRNLKLNVFLFLFQKNPG